MKTLEITNDVEGGSLPRLVRRFRGLRSMLSLVESGDGIVGATADSLAMRKQLRADAEKVSAEIVALDGQRYLLACPRCDGRGHQPSYDLEPPKCTRCKGSGYRLDAPNVKNQAREPSVPNATTAP